MDPSDFIGFFISLLALAFLFFRKRREAQRRREHPELYKEEEEQQEEDSLKDFLKSINMPVDERHPQRPVRQYEAMQPKIIKIKAQTQTEKIVTEEKRLKNQIEKRQLQNSIDDRRLKNTIEERKLESNLENRYADPYGVTDTGKNAPSYEIIQGVIHRSRVQEYLDKLPNKKEMVIFQEIIGPPKGMR